MGRPLRPEAPGRTFHLTARAVFGRELFVDDTDRGDFMRLLARTVRRYGWHLMGWCLMGTHYHLLVRTPAANLGAGMRDLNGSYARAFNQRHGRYGSVFADRYADRVIRGHEHFVNALQYLAMNPVHARLVDRPERWRWSSHGALAGLARYRRLAVACARRAARALSGTSQTTASGGRTTSAENGWSFQGTGSARTPSPLPTSEPP
jgi:REP-associated tyrosine transposase